MLQHLLWFLPIVGYGTHHQCCSAFIQSRWTSRFRLQPPAVRIKALQANHIPRFQTNSVRNSAGRQNTTPLGVSAGRQTGRNYLASELGSKTSLKANRSTAKN